MPRSYSEKFLLSLTSADPEQVGVQLGRLCVEGNIPAAYIATAFGVSRITVYSWFRGQDIRKKNRKIMEAMIDLMRKDFENEILPVKTRFDAKEYIQTMMGVQV